VTVVLLTGFEPFGRAGMNPSWEAVRLVEGVTVACVPCRYDDAVDTVWDVVSRVEPDVVLSVGQADGRAGINVERIAINLADARIPDNGGAQPRESPSVAGGPAAYFATIPVGACVEAARAAGVPAAVSYTAGTFVCNHLFYGLLHRAALVRLALRIGFVHVPLAPEQAVDGGVPTMPVETTAHALRAIVTALA